MVTTSPSAAPRRRLYDDQQRLRRDRSPWTRVQALLAPLQFLVFAVSLCLVLRYLHTGLGFREATLSVVVKTVVLYAIMVTGSLWERDVYGRYLFAPAFFWEDVVSMAVVAIHTAYLVGLVGGMLGPRGQMLLALLAYATYLVNAAQYLVKFSLARREREVPAAGHLEAAR